MEAVAVLERFTRNLRLLEAAGVAEGMSTDKGDAFGVFAQLCRNYHAALQGGAVDGLQLGTLTAPGLEAHDDLLQGVVRLREEILTWADKGAPHSAYLDFLIAYEAMNNLDGDRMMASLSKVVAVLRGAGSSDSRLADVEAYCTALDDGPAALEGVWSSYEAMQVVADVLTAAAELPEHALSDVSRFALRAPR